ncbi:hypothetical protein SAMCCGM7_pA0250 (plasmid) [Sinorhizobium americanum CCGM7]|nr:hypothetical protein SAMCCGM7_pA0250 [Sinorhizobium americanum CCGM7]
MLLAFHAPPFGVDLIELMRRNFETRPRPIGWLLAISFIFFFSPLHFGVR